MQVPYFRPSMTDAEIQEVVAVLKSGWLTTGPMAKRFEQEFAAAVGASHAVAVNSATAALHLAVEAVGLRAGQAVLVPTLTFAATAEIVRYMGAFPVLVDCDPVTLNMDLADAEAKLADLRAGRLPGSIDRDTSVVGIIPVHVGGLMMDIAAIDAFAKRHGIWVVEDAAHAFPSGWRSGADQPWRRCGGGTARITCFSFYANKTITTGEGGMATTEDAGLAERMRTMSLHGLSQDAWKRFSGGSWDYQIVAPGFKYNLTDVAAAIGVHQLARAEDMRRRREALAHVYREGLAGLPTLELPPVPADRQLSWHLFPVRLTLGGLSRERDTFMGAMKERGVGTSVHWRPLHLHPYYSHGMGWRTDHLPAATRVWPRLVSLPLFPDMTPADSAYVIRAVRELSVP